MEKQFKLDVPKPKSIDVIYGAGEALSNLLPIAGPELFRLIVSSPLENRRMKWMEEVSQALLELCNRSTLNFTDLVNNEEFVSLAMHTSKVAIAEHEEEKLRYLRNALLNSLLQDISYDMKCLFINAVSQLSPRHIVLLKFIIDNEFNRGAHITDNKQILDRASALYFSGDNMLAAVFFDNLLKLNFLERRWYLEERHTILQLQGDYYHYSNWGKEFLNFIAEPGV